MNSTTLTKIRPKLQLDSASVAKYTPIEFSERQKRERRYYEEFSRLTEPVKITFDPVEGQELRPWNSWWNLYEQVRNLYRSPEQKLLDFGCGNGTQAMRYAYIGYEVHGFDCCDNNIDIARRLASRYTFGSRTRFSVQVAENLDYPDEEFDIIVGTAVLHHVEIEPAIREVMRVLKPGGVAFFWEPVDVPAFDRVRNSRIGKFLVPKGVSFEKHITEDERKLDANDIALIRKICPELELQRFLMLSRFNCYLSGPRLLPAATLEKTDQLLFRLFPFLEQFGGVGIFKLHK